MGRGDRVEADRAATEAMRRTMDETDIAGTIVIGEGERDEAPMLYIGEQVGRHEGDPEAVEAVDIAVDPLEGTNLVATGQGDAITVLAASEKGGLTHAPDTYLEKLCVGPVAAGCVDITRPPAENCHRIAEALRRRVQDITVIILDRPRHDDADRRGPLDGRPDQAHQRRRPVGRHLVRRAGHRRARRHGHRRRTRGRDHRGRAALPGRRDPGPVPVPQRRGARAREGVEDARPRRRGPRLPDRGPGVGRPARVRGHRGDARASCSRASGSSAAAPGRTRS